MTVGLVAVGRLRAGPIKQLFDDYIGRLSWPVALIEVEQHQGQRREAALDGEGERLLKALDGLSRRSEGLAVIALDERGTMLRSDAFARQITGWRDRGAQPVFIIGGAEGLARPVLERAELVLSLGPMTWPHFLVRVLVAEQLYRAQSILAGHPYHRA